VPGFTLETLLEELHKSVSEQLARARRSWGHSVAKGDAAENVWVELLSHYLPQRYKVSRAFVCDSKGEFSEQLDVVVYDRQYTPPIFHHQGQIVLPAESIYAVFEAKQVVTAKEIEYAGKKIASVRKLHRTSLAIPDSRGSAPPKLPGPILGGFLSFESNWSPPLGKALTSALCKLEDEQRIDLGCVAAHGWFKCDDERCNILVPGNKPATAFLLELIARLQQMATVPMIDVGAYASWLVK
jgi:hypothetical protein